LRRRSAGAHPKWKKNKRPGSFAESGPLEFRVRPGASSDAAASRTGMIPGRAMLGRLPRRLAVRTRRDGGRERAQAGEGDGVAKGDPAGHDGGPGSSGSTCRGRRFVQGFIAHPSDRTQCK